MRAWGGKPAGVGIRRVGKEDHHTCLVLRCLLARGKGAGVSISNHWIKAFRLVPTCVRSCGLGSISCPLLGFDWPHPISQDPAMQVREKGFRSNGVGWGWGEGGLRVRERERESI